MGKNKFMISFLILLFFFFFSYQNICVQCMRIYENMMDFSSSIFQLKKQNITSLAQIFISFYQNQVQKNEVFFHHENYFDQNVDSFEESIQDEEKKKFVSSDLVESDFFVLESYIGSLSGYGPDCYLCSGYLASGDSVLDGHIYYHDPTYGDIRILAGDSRYAFGTIVRVKNSVLGDFLGIVLDRGGSIGFGKKFLFDLLYSTEAQASINGVSHQVTFEILRYGYSN